MMTRRGSTARQQQQAALQARAPPLNSQRQQPRAPARRWSLRHRALCWQTGRPSRGRRQSAASLCLAVLRGTLTCKKRRGLGFKDGGGGEGGLSAAAMKAHGVTQANQIVVLKR
jgi:hypothetical protein